MRKLSQCIAASLILIAILFAGLEAMAKYAPALQSAPPAEPMYLDDPIMGARPNPKYGDHDTSGWRNAEALGHVDIIALGDSQTYGIGADRAHAWPQQLSADLGRPVYQIAFGGYNPTTFVRLLPEVLEHKPKLVILGLYFGANFAQAYDDAYNRRPDPVLVSMRSTDGSTLAVLKKANEIDGNKWVRAQFLDCQRPRRVPDPALLRIVDIMDSPPLLPLAEAAKDDSGAELWNDLTAYSRVARDLTARVTAARSVAEDVVPEQAPPICVHHSAGAVETILTPAYRLLNLETTDPRIVEGERIAIASVRYLHKMFSEKGIQFAVVLIPTKESAFEFDNPTASPALRYLTRLWDKENAARARVSEQLVANGITVIDARPNLRHLIADDVDPYLGIDGNGHPSGVGYAAIARAVADGIREMVN